MPDFNELLLYNIRDVAMWRYSTGQITKDEYEACIAMAEENYRKKQSERLNKMSNSFYEFIKYAYMIDTELGDEPPAQLRLPKLDDLVEPEVECPDGYIDFNSFFKHEITYEDYCAAVFSMLDKTRNITQYLIEQDYLFGTRRNQFHEFNYGTLNERIAAYFQMLNKAQRLATDGPKLPMIDANGKAFMSAFRTYLMHSRSNH